MNLRTDEIGKAEDTLKQLHGSLVEKKKDIDEQYRAARNEESRLRRVQENMKTEIESIAKAYKEITGSELKNEI